MASETIFSSSSSQQRWVDQITKTVRTQITIDINDPISIFKVPETIISEKPEAYTPQHIGLGPYHHLCPNLYKMEFQKLSAVKNVLNSDQIQTLFIDKLKKLEPRIRACYDNYLDLDSDTLAWIMAIDSLFLFNQLSSEEGKYAQDIAMLENQIPAFLFTENSEIITEESFNSKVLHFCRLNSPLKLTEESRFFRASYLHLLDYMYNLIVNNRGILENGVVVGLGMYKRMGRILDDAKKVMDAAGDIAAIAGAPQVSAALTFIKSLPCDQFFSLCSSKEDSRIHVAEEIKIPSVSQLSDTAKVKFCVTPGGIRDIKFDTEELTFHLPVITLNNNGSEIVLRNLVAYEALMAKPGDSLEIAEYVDLMCGIIDTAKDVELLREKGIVFGDLGNEEIANMFNGINKSTGNGERKYELKETVEKVNERFDNRPKVRVCRFLKNFMNKYVYGSWKMLVLLASVVLLLMIVLQSFCTIYGCSSRFSVQMISNV